MHQRITSQVACALARRAAVTARACPPAVASCVWTRACTPGHAAGAAWTMQHRRAQSTEAVAASPAAPTAPPAAAVLPPAPEFTRTPVNTHAGPRTRALPERGFMPEDPLPDRPPEDDIATCTAYFEVLVGQYKVGKDLPSVLMRVSRLRDPRNWVNVLHVFTCRRVRVPELVEFLQQRFLGRPTRVDAYTSSESPLASLDGQHLSALAFAMHAQGGADKALFEAIVERARALGSLRESEHANLSVSLRSAGLTPPEGVKVVPDEP